MKPNIIERVVEQDRCIGCSACVAICPVNILSIGFNDSGCYQAYEVQGCLDKCSLCIKVCPFDDKDKHENSIAQELFSGINGINFKKYIGYYTKTYEFSKLDMDDKLESASGGAGNYILTELLNKNLVDKVLAVEPNNDPEKLFKFSIFSNTDELKNSRSSAYYPVTMDEILEYVSNNDERFAVTALPCFAKAIRLLQKNNRKFRNRIKFVIGLVCGQMKSKKFAQTLAELNFKQNNVVLSKVNFRKKQESELASNFAFEFIDDKGNIAIDARRQSPVKFWASRAYTPLACNNCYDTFAVTSDVTLMDAWLKDKIQDYSGHSLIISRNKDIDDILIQKDENIDCKEFSVDLVLKSQIPVVQNKLNFATNSGNIFHKIEKKLKLEIQKTSLEKDKKELFKILDKNLKTIKFITLPNRAINKLKRMILK